MDSRKLIKLGNNSHVISLPNEWLRKNKLTKGNLIYFEENGNNEVILKPGFEETSEVQKEIIISIDNSSLEEINRRINSAYINNFHTIIVQGKTLRKNAKKIRTILQDLMALEIMEQNAYKIVAKDFLNMKKISIEKLIKRLDLITKAMLVDTKVNISKSIYENINTRDEDVNRIAFLLFRSIKYFLDNPYANPNLTSIKLLELWQITNYIEKVADETKRIARYLNMLRLNSKQKKFFEDLLSKIEKNYFESMKSYYKKDLELAYQLSMSKKKIILDCNKFLAKNYSVKWIPNIIERIRAINDHIHTIVRITYQKLSL